MLTADQQSLLTAISAKKNNLQEMLRRPNVIACGVGYKVTNNGITDELEVQPTVLLEASFESGSVPNGWAGSGAGH